MEIFMKTEYVKNSYLQSIELNTGISRDERLPQLTTKLLKITV